MKINDTMCARLAFKQRRTEARFIPINCNAIILTAYITESNHFVYCIKCTRLTVNLHFAKTIPIPRLLLVAVVFLSNHTQC